MRPIWRAVRYGATSLLVLWPFAFARAQQVGPDDFKTVVIDPDRQQISLHWKNDRGEAWRSLAALKTALEAKGQKVLALMNAGIYDRKYRPLGLHVERGQVLRKLDRRRGGGNFYMKPNGVFYIGRNGAAIVRTSQFHLSDDIVLATQSGPLLFDRRGIHPAFARKSKYRHYRNAVGVRGDGHVVFVMSKRPVTFWQLAHFLRDDQKCLAGLYMDGFISQLWRNGERGPGRGYPFVGMLAATEKGEGR